MVAVHGFTQTGRLWGPFGERLAASRTVVAVDLPGHAGSDRVRADLPATAELVTEAARGTVGDAPCDVLGYSLGARVALHVVTGTDLDVRSVICIGGTGGIEDIAARERRRRRDETLAEDLEATGDVDGFLARWLAGPLFARLSATDAAGGAERHRNTAAGLASSLRLCGAGTHEPLWDRLPEVASPLLALAGADDTRFASHALRLAAPRAARFCLARPGRGSRRPPRPTRPDVADRAALARVLRSGPQMSNPIVNSSPTAS